MKQVRRDAGDQSTVRLIGGTWGGRKIRFPDGTEFQTWDAWNHYHCLLGLLLWHEETGDQGALLACCRVGDLFCRMFLDRQVRLATTTPLAT